MAFWINGLRRRLGRHFIPQSLASQINAVAARVEALEGQTIEHVKELKEKVRLGRDQVDALCRQVEVRTVMDWIAAATVRNGPLISVVLPTRDRCERLGRAIRSVEAQSYGNYELLVVDDASVDATPGYLARLTNERIRSFRADGKGVGAARNVALSHAAGALIAYLDDDNFMHPQWLKSVAWLFEQRPETQVGYGAYIVDDPARIDPAKGGDLPRLRFEPYERSAVLELNIADIGCIVHRAGLAEAHFDETLREMGDWDMFLRLTRDAPPARLPAIACYYTTDSPNRLSFGPTHLADYEAVRAKNPY